LRALLHEVNDAPSPDRGNQLHAGARIYIVFNKTFALLREALVPSI